MEKNIYYEFKISTFRRNVSCERRPLCFIFNKMVLPVLFMLRLAKLHAAARAALLIWLEWRRIWRDKDSRLGQCELKGDLLLQRLISQWRTDTNEPGGAEEVRRFKWPQYSRKGRRCCLWTSHQYNNNYNNNTQCVLETRACIQSKLDAKEVLGTDFLREICWLQTWTKTTKVVWFIQS